MRPLERTVPVNSKRRRDPAAENRRQRAQRFGSPTFASNRPVIFPDPVARSSFVRYWLERIRPPQCAPRPLRPRPRIQCRLRPPHLAPGPLVAAPNAERLTSQGPDMLSAQLRLGSHLARWPTLAGSYGKTLEPQGNAPPLGQASPSWHQAPTARPDPPAHSWPVQQRRLGTAGRPQSRSWGGQSFGSKPQRHPVGHLAAPPERRRGLAPDKTIWPVPRRHPKGTQSPRAPRRRSLEPLPAHARAHQAWPQTALPGP